MKKKDKNEEKTVNIVYIPYLDKFRVEYRSYSEEGGITSTKWYTTKHSYSTHKTEYVNYDKLKSYNDYIAIFADADFFSNRVKLNKTDKDILYNIFDKNYSEKTFSNGYDVIIKGCPKNFDAYNNLEDVSKDYNILYADDILINAHQCGKNNKTNIPSINEIMKNTPTPEQEEDVNGINAFLDEFLDTDKKTNVKKKEKTCEDKEPCCSCDSFRIYVPETETKTEVKTKIVPIVESKTPVILFNGTFAQNLAVFYSFYKVEEGQHFLPTKDKYFEYSSKTKSFVEEDDIIYEADKRPEVIDVKKYIKEFDDKDTVEILGNRIFDYIISWFQFEMSDKSMIAVLLTSSEPFSIIIDDKKIEGFDKITKTPARFEEIKKYVNNKFGKPLEWVLDNNNVLHITINRNYFLES